MTDAPEQADIKTWMYDVDDLDCISLDAPQNAKKIVADSTGLDYSDLRSKLINPSTFTSKYVIVIDYFDRYEGAESRSGTNSEVGP